MTTLELPFPDIDPVAINLFGLKIHWYAIMYLIAFAMAYVLMRRRLRHEPFRSISTPSRSRRCAVADAGREHHS